MTTIDLSGFSQQERLDEENRVWAACLEQHGVPTEFRDGGVRSDSSGISQETMESIVEACFGVMRDAGFGGVSRDELTDEQLMEQYDQQIDLLGCLRENGFVVEDYVSRQTFLVERGNVPSVFARLSEQVPHDEWERANDVCPQI